MAAKKKIIEESVKDYDLELMTNKEVKEEKEDVMSPTEKETTVPEPVKGKISKELFVNIRRDPSMNNDPMDVLEKGDEVEIIGEIGDFYKVRFKNGSRIGYVLKELCEEV